MRKFERAPQGRGSHFDVHLDFLRHDQPWLGIYNLSGCAAVRVFALPDHMARVYYERFPSASRQGYEWRRHYPAVALNDMTEAPATGVLVEGTGLVIPQQRDGFQWVHEIVPVVPESAGEFLKSSSPPRQAGRAVGDQLPPPRDDHHQRAQPRARPVRRGRNECCRARSEVG